MLMFGTTPIVYLVNTSRITNLTNPNIVENILPSVTECHTLRAVQSSVGAAIRKVRESFCPPLSQVRFLFNKGVVK